MDQQQTHTPPTVPPQQATYSIPDQLWTMMVVGFQLLGIGLFAVGVIAIVQKPNSVNQFIGIQDRTPIVTSIRYVGDVALMAVGLLILVLAASQKTERARDMIGRVFSGLFSRWNALAKSLQLLLTVIILLVIAAWNVNQIMSVPFNYTRAWDTQAAVYRSAKEAQLIEIIKGLEEGCILCTPGAQPIENISTGDDIGQFFFFGVGHKLGLFPASLAGYQQFTAISIALIILVCAAVTALGFRSLLAGIVLALVITLLDNAKYHESLLITSYWVPGGAGLLSAALTVALMGRAHLDQGTGTKRAYWFYYAAFGLWGLIAGWAYLGRSSAGPISLVSALVVLIILVARSRRFIRWLPAAGLVLTGFVLVVLVFRFALDWRVTRYNLAPPIPNTMVNHAFSHAVLVGMGYVINEEGLRWDDATGARFAREACPDAVYLGPEYYNCVRDVVINIVTNNPNLLIRNLLVKTEATIQVTFGFFPFAFLVLVALYLIREPMYYLMFGVLLALNAAPSLLTVPYVAYLQGYFQIFVVFIAAGIIIFGKRLATTLKPTT